MENEKKKEEISSG